jgi:hypothetical protein
MHIIRDIDTRGYLYIIPNSYPVNVAKMTISFNRNIVPNNNLRVKMLIV